MKITFVILIFFLGVPSFSDYPNHPTGNALTCATQNNLTNLPFEKTDTAFPLFHTSDILFLAYRDGSILKCSADNPILSEEHYQFNYMGKKLIKMGEGDGAIPVNCLPHQLTEDETSLIHLNVRTSIINRTHELAREGASGLSLLDYLNKYLAEISKLLACDYAFPLNERLELVRIKEQIEQALKMLKKLTPIIPNSGDAPVVR